MRDTDWAEHYESREFRRSERSLSGFEKRDR